MLKICTKYKYQEYLVLFETNCKTGGLASIANYIV